MTVYIYAKGGVVVGAQYARLESPPTGCVEHAVDSFVLSKLSDEEYLSNYDFAGDKLTLSRHDDPSGESIEDRLKALEDSIKETP